MRSKHTCFVESFHHLQCTHSHTHACTHAHTHTHTHTMHARTYTHTHVHAAPARIDTQDFTRYAKLDEAIDIECKAKGIPTPEIIYYRQGDPSRIRESLSFRAVKEEDAGTYHCRARNNYFNMETHQMQEISVVTTINLVVSCKSPDYAFHDCALI